MSVGPGILERMFDEAARAEVIARFEEEMERRHPSKTPESTGLALSALAVFGG
jgi:hypothetical protein